MKIFFELSFITIGLLIFASLFLACNKLNRPSISCTKSNFNNLNYVLQQFPLQRNNLSIYLDKISLENTTPTKNILLIHGLTYSSHEFDINYKDYSLVRKLACSGYAVWRLDITGFGRSEQIINGYLPDTKYAADDVLEAVKKILAETKQEKIDILGWSWGTVIISKFLETNSKYINKAILYAPILSGVGLCDFSKPFNHNSWEHAASDFAKTSDGNFNYSITDPIIIELWCSSCFHYDGEYSPNGGRKDICVSKTKKLINFDANNIKTLIIYGDSDPYLNYELLNKYKNSLPSNFKFEEIKGGSHILMIEKPYYKDFQNRVLKFLND